MTAAQREEMYRQITQHGEQLKKVFDLPETTDPVKLCKKLFTIEKQLHRVMVNLCNTNNIHGIEPHYETRNGARVWVQIETSEEEQEKLFDQFKDRIEKILGKNTMMNYNRPGYGVIFFNHDPRGYSIKISEATAREHGIYQDWGGYGIIAPDFTPNN